jgi:hypothetical protein
MVVHDMAHEAEAAAQADVATAPRRIDLLGIACLSTIAVAMTAWIGGLIWLALALVNWLAS